MFIDWMNFKNGGALQRCSKSHRSWHLILLSQEDRMSTWNLRSIFNLLGSDAWVTLYFGARDTFVFVLAVHIFISRIWNWKERISYTWETGKIPDHVVSNFSEGINKLPKNKIISQSKGLCDYLNIPQLNPGSHFIVFQKTCCIWDSHTLLKTFKKIV